MIFIGGVSHGSAFLPYTKSILCRFCQSRTECQVIMTYYYFSFFFVPLFKWHRRYFVKTNCCETVYELNSALGKAIARGEMPDITGSDLRMIKEGHKPFPYERMQAFREEGEGDPNKKLRCPICKQEVPGNYNYCPNCGQRLR